MVSVVGKRSQHHVNRRTILTTATFVVRDRNYAVNIRIFLPAVQSKLSDHGDLLGFMTGAHAGRHDQYVVSRAHAPIRPAKAEKCSALVFRDVVGRGDVKVLWK